MFQTIILAGNLGRDPEMRYTPTGQAVTSFSVATNRQWTNNNGETIKETVWFRVSAWGKLAETCNQFLKKGAKVLVEGRLTADSNTGGPRVWTAQDGQPRASFEVNAQTVRFLSSRTDSAGETGSATAPAEDGTFGGDGDENIPF
jgi:single-strand DNA-binding protein